MCRCLFNFCFIIDSLISSVANKSKLREVRVQYSGMVVDTKQGAIYVKVTLLGVPNIQGKCYGSSVLSCRLCAIQYAVLIL